jgi:hypothetical protein
MVSPSSDTREKAIWIYKSWDEKLQKYAHRRGTPIPIELKRTWNNPPLTATSLAAAICHWVDEQGQDVDEIWNMVLAAVETTPILQHGYGQLKDPNLAWLFTPSVNGTGIERVLDGRYHWQAGHISSADEGV